MLALKSSSPKSASAPFASFPPTISPSPISSPTSVSSRQAKAPSQYENTLTSIASSYQSQTPTKNQHLQKSAQHVRQNSEYKITQKENIAPSTPSHNCISPYQSSPATMSSLFVSQQKFSGKQVGSNFASPTYPSQQHKIKRINAKQYTDSVPNIVDLSPIFSPSINKKHMTEPIIERSQSPPIESFLLDTEGTERNESIFKPRGEISNLSQGLSLPTLEKVIQLSDSLNRSHQQMQECHDALKASIKRQNEIKAYYQSLVKHMTSQKENDEASLVHQIQLLEQENENLRKLTGTTNGNGTHGMSSSKSHRITTVSRQALQECKKMKFSLDQMKREVFMFNSELNSMVNSRYIAYNVQKIASKNFGNRDYKSEKNRLEEQLEYVKRKYNQELKLRKQLQNELIEEKGNIRVYCRIRPFLKNEKKETLLRILGDDCISVTQKSGKTRQFDLDTVYPMETSQEQIFEDVKPLLASVFDGYNVCILAYGQTGSGKTYTMEGSGDNPGVIPRALYELFAQAKQKQDLFHVKLTLSMIEIYNNDIRDLLSSPRQPSRKIEYADVGEGGLEVRNVTLVEVTDINEVKKFIKIGSSHRAECVTQMNNSSSRSHSIVTIEVECQQNEKCRQKLGMVLKTTKAKLRLVDLAGSECVGMSGVKGEAQMEASHVNRSLSALSDVMKALSTPNRTHIPYRNSRLTHLLQDSLGGDAKMIIFINVNPSLKCVTETTHSLSFGSRVRHVTRGKAPKHTKS